MTRVRDTFWPMPSICTASLRQSTTPDGSARDISSGKLILLLLILLWCLFVFPAATIEDRWLGLRWFGACVRACGMGCGSEGCCYGGVWHVLQSLKGVSLTSPLQFFAEAFGKSSCMFSQARDISRHHPVHYDQYADGGCCRSCTESLVGHSGYAAQAVSVGKKG